MYHALVTAVLVVHFGFVAYVVAGGFLAWRWAWTWWLHLAAAVWGLLVVTAPLECPLTALENWARRRTGEPVATTGFIDRYIEGVIYPPKYTHLFQVLVALTVVGSWSGVWFRKHTGRKSEETS